MFSTFLERVSSKETTVFQTTELSHFSFIRCGNFLCPALDIIHDLNNNPPNVVTLITITITLVIDNIL